MIRCSCMLNSIVGFSWCFILFCFYSSWGHIILTMSNVLNIERYRLLPFQSFLLRVRFTVMTLENMSIVIKYIFLIIIYLCDKMLICPLRVGRLNMICFRFDACICHAIRAYLFFLFFLICRNWSIGIN